MTEKISKDEAIVICRKALNTWGYAIQKVVAMEECSELIEALVASRLSEEHNVEEEVADVEIMCLQLRLIYGSKKVDETLVGINDHFVSRSRLDLVAIKACTQLTKAISKSIREKESNIYESIAWMEIIYKQLRYLFKNDKVDEIKQAKLKRLKKLVW